MQGNRFVHESQEESIFLWIIPKICPSELPRQRVLSNEVASLQWQ
jgi:hypothetical protein